MNKEQAIHIVDLLLQNAKGKVCSRYVLGLERAKESLQKESPADALAEQKAWALKRKERKSQKKSPK